MSNLSRATENGPAFCECSACTPRSASPLAACLRVGLQHWTKQRTKEMVNPVLSTHVPFSLVVFCAGALDTPDVLDCEHKRGRAPRRRSPGPRVGRGQRGPRGAGCGGDLAVRETVILLHPPVPLAGVSIGINRGCQQNKSLAGGGGDQRQVPADQPTDRYRRRATAAAACRRLRNQRDATQIDRIG